MKKLIMTAYSIVFPCIYQYIATCVCEYVEVKSGISSNVFAYTGSFLQIHYSCLIMVW